jgi:hypothetical protein
MSLGLKKESNPVFTAIWLNLRHRLREEVMKDSIQTGQICGDRKLGKGECLLTGLELLLGRSRSSRSRRRWRSHCELYLEWCILLRVVVHAWRPKQEDPKIKACLDN